MYILYIYSKYIYILHIYLVSIKSQSWRSLIDNCCKEFQSFYKIQKTYCHSKRTATW